MKQGVAFVDPDARRTLLEAPLLGLTQFGSRRTRIRPLADDGHPPLIFLHGLGAHPGNFRPMRAALALRGRRRTYSVGFGPHTSTLEMAQQVREAIADIATVNDLSADAQVDIVAHSMGGLVARAALLDPATAARVRTVVTLGTPHAGTHLARLAASRKLLDLRPGSDVVEAIAAQLPWPGPPSMPRLVALWSDADVLVQPHQSAAVEGAENVPLSGITHLGYLLDPAMWRLVGDALAKSDAQA